MQNTKDSPLRAVVIVPHRDGHNGPFFEAECEIGKVTVSLDKSVWQEDDRPEGGIAVMLWDIRRKRQGWRAYRARFFRPSDEQLFGNKETMRTSNKGLSPIKII